jgi:hypothetical protein
LRGKGERVTRGDEFEQIKLYAYLEIPQLKPLCTINIY